MASRGSRTVLVDNIPYEYTEEQLKDIFKEVGPVVSFKLAVGRESGRPKTFGYCEYYDIGTAASAVRNLNNYDLGGGRLLRVDFADMEPQVDANRQQPAQVSISKTLATMNPTQLLDVIVQMKTLVQSNPDQARIFLSQNPPLTYALFQSMVKLQIADPTTIQRLLAQQYAATAQPTPPPQPPQMQVRQPYTPAYSVPPQPQHQMPPQPQPPIPTQPQLALPQIPVQQAGVPLDAHEQQKVLLVQVLKLTQHQIDSLPQQQRENVMALKQQIMMRQQPY